MRNYTTIVILIISATVFGQTKDIRAKLKIKGRVNEISVSPNEHVWLSTATGHTYYTNNISSDWHYGEPLFEEKDGFGMGGPHLDRISFFNNDTAIISGYISVSEKEHRKNGYYLTRDGGKNWKLKDYGGNSWIYTIYVDKNGNAWMGGASNEIYISNDFGESWSTAKLPYKSSDRTYGIHMIDNKNGISSSDNNEILFTENNWENAKNIETPLNQKKYTNSENGYSDNRISKIHIWNEHIVINQNGNIFYTEVTKINWKKFPIDIVDFEIDNDSKELFAISKNLKVILFSSPNDYEHLSKKSINSHPIDIKVANSSLYVIDNSYEIYKINKSEFIRSIPYTTDRKISKPRIVKQHKKLTWGISGNQIYLSENDGKDWYRENAINFSVTDFQLKSDSLAILWDGNRNNFTYSLNNHTPKIHFPNKPLKSFLSSPIESFSINSGSQGCFHSMGNKVEYNSKDKSTLTTSKVLDNSSKKSKFKNEVSSHSLFELLQNINESPSLIPSIKEFNITQEDKSNYLSLVDDRLKADDDFLSKRKKVNKEYYYNILKMLDTLDNKVIEDVLNQQEGIWSTTSNWFTIRIINQNNDTINISRSYYSNSLPWNLPWKFEFNGQHFNCYNIDFSRFINNCIPKDFMAKEVFDNKFLIMEIADYLYNKEK